MTDFNTEDGLDLFDELNSLYEEELENEQSAGGADALRRHVVRDRPGQSVLGGLVHSAYLLCIFNMM